MRLFRVSCVVSWVGLLGCEPAPDKPDASASDHDDADGDGDPDASDCAPDDATVHAGAVESCNGRDDDCDGTVDEGPEGFPDGDRDGFGVGDAPVDWCAAGEGVALVAVSGDCDDRNPDVHPGAAERSCDGVDQDCDGQGDKVYFDDGRHFGSLAEALLAAGDGEHITLCAGTHPTQARLESAISVVISGASGEASQVVLDGEGSGPILFVANGAQVELHALTFQDGRSGPWLGGEAAGGAIAIAHASASIHDCVFLNNSARYGGAIFFKQDSEKSEATAGLTIADSWFEGNGAGYSGGAVNVVGNERHGAVVEVARSTFMTNTAGYEGGGIAVEGEGVVDLSLRDVAFFENHARYAGGGLLVSGHVDYRLEASGLAFKGDSAGYEGGGALIGGYGDGEVIFAESRFEGCAAGYGGGGLVLRGHGDRLFVGSRLSFLANVAETEGGAVSLGGYGEIGAGFDDSSFVGNRVLDGSGGAVAVGSRGPIRLRLDGVDFDRNEASAHGGGLDCGGRAEVALELLDTAWTHNVAGRAGGAVSISSWAAVQADVSGSSFVGNTAGTDGGAVAATTSWGAALSVRMSQTTLEANTAHEDGGAAYLGGPPATGTSGDLDCRRSSCWTPPSRATRPAASGGRSTSMAIFQMCGCSLRPSPRTRRGWRGHVPSCCRARPNSWQTTPAGGWEAPRMGDATWSTTAAPPSTSPAPKTSPAQPGCVPPSSRARKGWSGGGRRPVTASEG